VKRFVLVMGALLGGCGPNAVLWTRVEAPLTVPSEVDAVTLRVWRAQDGEQIFEQTYDLVDLGVAFPLELSLTNSNQKNFGDDSITVEASALSGGALAYPWSVASTQASILEGQITEALIRISRE
jgi:hypothetical protein